MSTRHYHVLILKCDLQPLQHRGDAHCHGTESFRGYNLSAARDEARKAGWLLKTSPLDGEALSRAYCPNRTGRRLLT